MSGGLTATGLLVLLLALIAAAVGCYYAWICLQARPLRPKKHKDAEHGPLIPPDPDVNGNHEDVPLDPSAPLHEDDNTDHKLHPDLPNEDDTSPRGAESPELPKEKEDVLISVEDDVPPAKVIHEKETAPAPTCVAPIGFVAPLAAASPQETPMDHHAMPRNLPPQPEKTESPSSSSNAPVPVYIPSPPQKKHNAISDEEDGLLLHEPPPQDDSLNADPCATLPASHARKPCLREEPETISQPSPPPPASAPTPEVAPPVIPPRQPAAVPKVDAAPQPEVQPVVVVMPQTTPNCPEKEELKPVGKAADSLPSENYDEPAPVYRKDDEHLPSAAATKQEVPIPSINETPVVEAVPPQTIKEETSIPTPIEAPAVEAVSPESVIVESEDPVNKETAVESDDSLSTGEPSETIEQTSKSVEDNVATKTSPENDDEEPKPEKTDIPEETASVSSCSVSSEDPELSPVTPVSAGVKPEGDDESVAPLESSHPLLEDEEVVTDDIPASPVATSETVADIPLPNTTEEPLSSPSVGLHSPESENEDLLDTASNVSDSNSEYENVPTVTSLKTETNPDKETPSFPSQPAADIPIDISNIPLEAYNIMPDDTSDEECSPLPVIKEEGSVDNNSEGSTDTDSSEPDVTEYSFSSGPSAPSTTSVLANEVSCTMEPKVTKINLITDLDASESEGSVISDEDLEEDDLASPAESSDDEVHNKTDSLAENKVIAEENPVNVNEANNAVSDHTDTSEKDSVPAAKPPVIVSNGPTHNKTPDPANKLEENEISHSDDSDTDSEGAEAEVELKEEMVSVPVAVLENTNNHTAPPNKATTSPSTNHTGKLTEACPPKPQPLKAAHGNSDSLEEIPTTTDEDDDGLSVSLSPSESCDLSDGEMTASTPKKSMIPRLVKQSEA